MISLNRADCLRKDVRVQAVVVSPLKLSDVQREIFARDFMECAHNSALKDAPEAFNRVGVNSTDNVIFCMVSYGMVGIVWREVSIGGMLVGGEKRAFVRNYFTHEAFKCFCFRVFDHARDNAALTLRSANDDKLLRNTCAGSFLVPMPVAVRSADVSFVYFDIADQLAEFRVGHSGTNSVRHVERRFIGTETHRSVNLVRGNAFLAREHDVDDAEPLAQADIRVLENCPDQNREPISVRAAFLALPMEGAGKNVAVGSAATRAIDAFWPAVAREISLAGVIVGESLFPLPESHLVNSLGGSHVPLPIGA